MADNKNIESFPLSHYSYSTFVRFSTNPILFKINYVNGDTIDTIQGISGVIGKAFHAAMAEYCTAGIQAGLEAGIIFLDEYPENFIEYSVTVPTKQKATEVLTFAYNAYVKEDKIDPKEKFIGAELVIEENISVEWKDQKITLPVKLKGYLDKIVENENGVVIKDYKCVHAFSNPDKIDGAKIIQAVQYYFLAYAECGKAPYSIIFEEVKKTKNRDNSPQVRRYEVIYADNDLFFDFYLRLYDDMTRAINGEAVFVPNVNAMYDNEVSIISYIHRLDVSDEMAKQMKELRVTTITDLLRSKIENAGNMRKLMQNAEKQFISAKSLEYDKMNTEEKIQVKMMEHGMLIKYDSKIEGHSVDLYRYNPSIGLKMSRLKGFVSDIEQVVGVSGVRVLAPIPNSTLIGFEVPKAERTFPTEQAIPEGFNLAIGVDIYNKTYRFDITKAPHLLVAGSTGSGKSVFLNSIIQQLATLSNIHLHLFDPKIVELCQFRSIAKEYYSDAESIYLALEELVAEMNRRYQKLSNAGARSLDEQPELFPRKFVVIDEYGDLALGSKPSGRLKKDEINISGGISDFVLTLAQKARAAGIHLIIATQRPSTDIITGTIKANFPTKVAFRTAKAVDSQVLLDAAGAEKLLGKGDMLFVSNEGEIRLQGFSC